MDGLSVKNVRLERKIGSGSFATVYKATDLRTQDSVAVKAIDLRRLNRKLFEGLSSEIAVMKEICHPHTVRLQEIQKEENHLFLIMEYCAGGDLSGLLKQHGILPECIVLQTVKQMSSALEALRMKNIVHRDLKPQNLLLSSASPNEIHIKIADFGFARPILPTDMAHTLCGSPLYMAPEILRYEKYNAKADLWSIGAIMYEMIYGRPPYQAQNHIQLQKLIDSQPSPQMPNQATYFKDDLGQYLTYQVSNECISIMRGLLQKNPIQRLSFEEFFMHPFLAASSTRPQSFSVPIKKSVSRESIYNRHRSRGKERSDDILTTQTTNSRFLAQDGPLARSLTSLSSSASTSMPPFARLKIGTPPTGRSILDSYKSSSDVSFTSSMRSDVFTDWDTEMRASKFLNSNPETRGVALIAIFAMDLCERQRSSLTSSGSVRISKTEGLLKLAAVGLLNALDQLVKMQELEACKYLASKLDTIIRMIYDINSLSIEKDSNETRCDISDLARTLRKMIREGVIQELVGKIGDAIESYRKVEQILTDLQQFVASMDMDLSEIEQLLLRDLAMVRGRLVLIDESCDIKRPQQ